MAKDGEVAPGSELKRRSVLSAAKAKKMLHDNSAQGHPLTGAQKRYFGAVAGGTRSRIK